MVVAERRHQRPALTRDTDMQIIIQIGKGARTVRVAPVRLHGVVRVTVKWLTALIILPTVALIYLPATVLAEILTTIAKAADSIGNRFDTFWDSDSNAERSNGEPKP